MNTIVMHDTPQKVCEYLNDQGYNPNSPTRSRRIARFVIEDLLEYNNRLEEDAENGKIVYETEHEIAPSVKPKLVIGTVNDPEPPDNGSISQTAPDQIWCAMSYASIMTRHNQNLNNRISEARLISFESFELDSNIVTASFVLTNIAGRVDFDHVDGERTHSNVEREVKRIRDRFGSIEGPPRENSSRPDAVGCVVLAYDGDSAEQYEEDPAPLDGDQLFYPDFVSKISNEIDSRFYNMPSPVNADPDELINFGEGRTIEFKSKLDHTKSLAAEASAFLNTEGGAILLGINDDGSVEGLESIDKTHSKATNTLYDHLDGDIVYETERANLDDEDVLIIRLPRSRDRLYEVDGKFFIRVGESKKSMRFDVLESHFVELFQQNPERLFE
jgi:hypothetical protein